MRVTTLLLLSLAACAAWTAPAGAAAGPVPERADAVRAVLGAFCQVPNEADWQRLGSADQVAAALIWLADADSEALHVRARAVSALAHFPRPEAQAAIERRLVADPDRGVLRRSAIRALGVAFPAVAVREAPALLGDPDSATREAAAQALAATGLAEAETPLKEALGREADAAVRATFERSLTDLRGRLASPQAPTPAAAPAPARPAAVPAVPRPVPRIVRPVPTP